MTINVAARACALVLFASVATPASAALFTAGPAGTHATIQGAINAALGAAGDDEVRIQSGVWLERIAFTAFSNERTEISGGWNAAFDARSDATPTVIDAENGGIALQIDANFGTTVVSHLSLTRGQGDVAGNLSVVSRGAAVFELTDCDIGQGAIQATGGVGGSGAGVDAMAFADSRITIARCHIHDNTIVTDGATGSGAGISAAVQGASLLQLLGLSVVDNSVTSAIASGAGLSVYAYGQGQVEIFDSLIADNTIAGNATNQSSSSGIGLHTGGPSDTTRIEFRRNRVLGNAILDGEPGAQMEVSVGAASQIILADSLIAQSPNGGGLAARQSDPSQLHLVNLTLAGNAGADLDASGNAIVSNTLADDLGELFEATVVKSRFGPSQGYVDRAGGDFRLLLTSPAIGAGTLVPEGGLGTLDLDGNARVRGYGVDLGAFEADDPSILVDGFES